MKKTQTHICNVNIVDAADQQNRQHVLNFFGRIRLLRIEFNIGREELIKRMRVYGSTLTTSSLSKYEIGALSSISHKQFLIYCNYFGVEFTDMIKPLTDQEQTKLNQAYSLGKAMFKHVHQNRA